jgi:GAF domain-containing protein
MLGEMAERVLSTRAFEEAVQTVLDDVIAFRGAQFGNVQLPIGDNLVIAAQRGFGPEFLQTFRRVKKDDGSACGRALRLGESIVVADVEKDADFAPYRNVAKRAGFRSVQSTPFITQNRKLIGIVSVHFAAPGRPPRNGAGAFEGFHLYSTVAAEKVYELLGGVAVAAKAAQMSDELYSSFALI